MVRLRFRVERGRFDRLVDRVEDPRVGLFPQVTDRLEDHFDETFRAGGSNVGRPWRPLSQVTLAIDRAANRNPNPVEQTPGVGRIRRSLTQRNAPYARRTMTRSRVTVGTKVSIASQVEGGFVNQAGVRVPGRVIAASSPRLVRDLVEIVDRHYDADRYA